MMKKYSTTLNQLLVGDKDILVMMYAHATVTRKEPKIGNCSKCVRCQPFWDALQCETQGKLMTADTAKTMTCEQFRSEK